ITAFFLALYYKHLSIVRLLLERRAHPSSPCSFNSLHAAARGGFEKEIIMFIQDFEVKVDIKDIDRATPIIYALQLLEKEASETIPLLFSFGAKKDAIVRDGCWTYANLARSMGRERLVTWLESEANDS
ncbi:hypothetical protein EDB81DRAFT_668723, partial [Dactylonectria macrodidyma]